MSSTKVKAPPKFGGAFILLYHTHMDCVCCMCHEIYMNFQLNLYRILINAIHESSIHIMADTFCESSYYVTSPILVNTNIFNMIDS